MCLRVEKLKDGKEILVDVAAEEVVLVLILLQLAKVVKHQNKFKIFQRFKSFQYMARFLPYPEQTFQASKKDLSNRG